MTETELGLAFFDERSPEAENPDYWERSDLLFPNEEIVMEIARAWGIAPTDIHAEDSSPALGLIGQLPR